MVSLPLADDDIGNLDLVLGYSYSLLDRDSEEVARDLLPPAVLTVRCDGGIYHPMSGDGWTVDTYQAVLTVDRALLPAFTAAVTDAIWQRLESGAHQVPARRCSVPRGRRRHSEISTVRPR